MLKQSNGETSNGRFFWFRVTSYTPATNPTFTLNGGQKLPVDCLESLQAPIGSPWTKIEVTGTIAYEVGEESDPYPGPVAR